MKKFISLITILLCVLCIYSCRESEEMISYPDIPNLHRMQKTENAVCKDLDSLQLSQEDDPPIRDGHDWKIKSDTIQ